jgi:hypothetical protein
MKIPLAVLIKSVAIWNDKDDGADYAGRILSYVADSPHIR